MNCNEIICDCETMFFITCRITSTHIYKKRAEFTLIASSVST